jgi:acetyl esterase/lipase
MYNTNESLLYPTNYKVLTTAIKRYRRQQERKLSRLSTIHEDFSYSQRAVNINEYPKKDVIFHLTGGGFFAHTIAGDVPYLMDWSFATEAVVICPEYALLPEHTFPVAIEEVTRVYLSLVNGHSPSLLGFQTDRIIVTGESTGGNLAASLCVKLCMDGLVDVEELTAEKRFRQAREETISQSTSLSFSEDDENDEDDQSHQPVTGMNRLPDALMLCCPALNLSLELSPSRVLGTKDAVLPSSLISTISDAYVPSSLQISKSDPIVSPYYAPDEILRIFPPTLLYASSEDPLLDDSVQFNTRLRANGVDSDLRAAHNVPHAYWGLGTAGFPEAVKVQRECEYWMVRQLHK